MQNFRILLRRERSLFYFVFRLKASSVFIKMAGAEGDRNRSLKEIIYESLNAILSPDIVTRTGGEEQIKALEVTEGQLCHIFKDYIGGLE